MRSDLNVIARYWRYYFQRIMYQDVIPRNPAHDDIYIVEFPKSGITWLSFLVGNIELQLNNKQGEHITFYNLQKYLVDIHQIRYSEINRVLPRTFIKSHARFNPYYHFVIYLIRNPFDVMVSYYNFMCDHGYMNDFESFVKHRKFGVLSWKKHVNSWHYKKSDDQRMHFVRYEDLLADTGGEIKKIYKNLGTHVASATIERAIKLSSLSFMKGSEEHYSNNNVNYSASFVGKKNKKLKKEILTKSIQKYIYTTTLDELENFYPETIEK